MRQFDSGERQTSLWCCSVGRWSFSGRALSAPRLLSKWRRPEQRRCHVKTSANEKSARGEIITELIWHCFLLVFSGSGRFFKVNFRPGEFFFGGAIYNGTPRLQSNCPSVGLERRPNLLPLHPLLDHPRRPSLLPHPPSLHDILGRLTQTRRAELLCCFLIT